MAKIRKREFLGKVKADPLKFRMCMNNDTLIHKDKKKEKNKKKCRNKLTY